MTGRRGNRRAAVSTSGGIDVAARCELAERMLPRAVGLLGRKGLEPGEGMLFSRTGSVHMFFMRFAIDVVFVDRARTIVKIVPNLEAVADRHGATREVDPRATRRGPLLRSASSRG